MMINDNLVLICGESKSGKTTSLRNLTPQEGVIYLNCEAGKKPTFASKFRPLTITDPLTIYAVFDDAEKHENIHTIIIDSQTFMMEMFYTVHVANAVDTQKAWGDYAEFFRKLMQYYVAKSTKNVIFTAHTLATFNESEHMMEKKVPVKGALKNMGVESYFSVVVAAKKVPLSMLENYQNAMLTITPDEEIIGVKNVFQTRLTKETVNERLTSPIGMFQINETFVDNDIKLILNRLREYYS